MCTYIWECVFSSVRVRACVCVLLSSYYLCVSVLQVHMSKSENNFEKLVLLPTMGSREQTQVIRLVQEGLLPAEPSHWAWFWYFLRLFLSGMVIPACISST